MFTYKSVNLTYLCYRVASHTSISGYFKYHAFFMIFFQYDNTIKTYKTMSKKITNNKRVMESGDHFKNGASPKRRISKRNFLKRFALLSAGIMVFGRRAGAQGSTITKTPLRAGSAKPIQITTFRILPIRIQYDYPKDYQYYARDYANKYPDSILRDFPQGVIEYLDTTKNISLVFDTQVITPVKVKYSIYTYKKTFSQDGKRNYWQGMVESVLIKPLTTQEDIDNALDKIYEFPAITETVSGQRELSWNGYTDSKFTGQKYPVRDCLYIAAHNADTGELIDAQPSITHVEMYSSYSLPFIVYRIDEHKDANGKVVKETLSGKVILAYPDSWPIKKITVLLTPDPCGYGALSFDVINQGAEAIVADINRRIPGEVIAHTTLTNPTVDKNNKNIKIFDWKDIKTEDGKDFIPDLEEYYGSITFCMGKN